MTVAQVIIDTDNKKPNQYSPEDKVKWLSELDGMVKRQVIDTHEGYDTVVFSPYDVDTDMDKKLLISEPYTSLYALYLFMQIDFLNAEYTRYNNSAAMFNSSYQQFVSDYNRTHKPLNTIKITL